MMTAMYVTHPGDAGTHLDREYTYGIICRWSWIAGVRSVSKAVPPFGP